MLVAPRLDNPNDTGDRTVPEIYYSHAIRQALEEEMTRDERVILLGEDIAEYGGAFKLTEGIVSRFGKHRVRNTPIAENGFIGVAVGAALTGLRLVSVPIRHIGTERCSEIMTRMHDDLAPDWPRSEGGYHIIIEGVPRMVCKLDMEDEHGDHAVGGVVLTATRLVNAIPAVCAASPGPLTALDLPLVTGAGLMAS